MDNHPTLPDDSSVATEPIRIGISSCLIGNEVRFDGGHKHDRFLTGTVGRFVEYVSVCPEVEVGMPIPRESVRLVRAGDQLRMVAPRSGADWTERMRAYAVAKAAAMAEQELCGFILKKDSPSCGMERVKVYAEAGPGRRDGTGLFAAELMRVAPLLPVEEEGRLHDPQLRENFFERVFAFRRLRSLLTAGLTVGRLVAFHTREKLLLMAHDRPAYTALGRLVARAREVSREALAVEYRTLFMGGMKKLATTRKHTNVLQHIAGHFKGIVPEGDRQELHGVIDDYRRGLVPLIVPITLARHHARVHAVDYLTGQTYLEPHPKELMLRNHV